MGPPIIKHPQGSMQPEMPRLPPQGSLGSMPMPGSGPGPGPGSGMGPGSSQGPGGGVGVKRQYPGEGPSGGASHATGAAPMPMGPSADAVAAKRARVGEPTITSKVRHGAGSTGFRVGVRVGNNWSLDSACVHRGGQANAMLGVTHSSGCHACMPAAVEERC